MELKNFVAEILRDILGAVENVRSDVGYGISFGHGDGAKTIEFDVAVYAEDSFGSSGKAGIKVFQMIEGGGELTKGVKNVTASRIKFGIHVNEQKRGTASVFKHNY